MPAWQKKKRCRLPREGKRQRLESNLPTTLRPDASLRDERGSGVPKHQPLVILAHDKGLAPPSELRYGRLDCSLRLLNTDIGKSVFRLRPKFPAKRQIQNALRICPNRLGYSTLCLAQNTMRSSGFLFRVRAPRPPLPGGPPGAMDAARCKPYNGRGIASHGALGFQVRRARHGRKRHSLVGRFAARGCRSIGIQ
jgi:hypothetical protein